MALREFLVPYGLIRGRLVPPHQAERYDRYWCPACFEPLVLRRGPLIRPNFAHPPGSDSQACSLESVLHRTAKIVVVAAVTDWRAGLGPRPTLVRRRCPRSHPPEVVQPLPNDILAAAPDVKLSRGRPADVVLYGPSNAVRAVIEICATTPRPAPRAADANLEVPWIELDALQVCESPTEWRCVEWSNLSVILCEQCDEIDRRHHVEQEKPRLEAESKRLSDEELAKAADEFWRKQRPNPRLDALMASYFSGGARRFVRRKKHAP